jgi:uncharacterized glyoxalase superfamily protein PhnB
MTRNRSMPPGVFIPELAYDDVAAAAEWLCRAFGFRERLRIGTHRVQLVLRGGSMVVMERGPNTVGAAKVMVSVEDVDAHHRRAREAGARILAPPADQPFGERQYTAQDPGGHAWTFSQSVADVDPATWGGELIPGSDG